MLVSTDVAVGLAFFLASVGTVAAAALLVTVRLTSWRASLAVLAWGVLTSAGVVGTHVLVGALGILHRGTVALAGLLVLAAAVVLTRGRARPDGGRRPVDASGLWEQALPGRAIGAVGLLTGLVWLVIVAYEHRFRAPPGFDATSAYLPAAARWAQNGSIWGFGDWVPGLFFGSSPGNGSVVILSGTIPWDHDFLARYFMFPFVALTALAVYCLARELRAPWSTASLLGLTVAAIPVLVEPAVVSALLDPFLYATFAAGLTFLLRHHRTGETADLLLAGAGLGLAFGTKFYAYLAVPLVWLIWVVARLVKGTDRTVVARQAAVIVGLVAAFGGIWIVRSFVETGNPFYPVGIGALGLDAPEDPLRPLVGSTLLDYATDTSGWSELRHQFRIAIGLPLVVIVGLVLVAAALSARRDRRDVGLARVGLVLAAVLTVAYAATPYTGMGPPGEPIIAAANVRYGLPALIAAVAVAGWATGHLGRIGVKVVGVLLLVGLLDALTVGKATAANRAVLALFAAIPAGLFLSRFGPRLLAVADRRRERLVRWGGTVVAVGLAVTIVPALDWLQRGYSEIRYTGDEALAWFGAQDDDALVVGLGGSWTDRGTAPIYPAFGPRLRNEVEYIGAHDDGLLVPHDTIEAFNTGLADLDPDVLVLGRAEPFIEFAGPGPAELGIAALEAGYRVVAESERLVVLTREDPS